MKILIIIILIIFTSFSLAQYQQKELLHINTNNPSKTSLRDISSDGFIILSEKVDNTNEYYLASINNIEDKKLIFSSNDIENDYIKFSRNDKLIVFRTKENNKFVVHIYDIDKQLYINIDHPNGDVVSASAINENVIIYQLREKESVPKIYQYSSSSNTGRFITEGMGELLSTNGKWIFVKKSNEELYLLRSSLKDGKITKEYFLDRMKTIKKIPPSCIYDLNGKLILQLDGFNNQIVEVDWTNDSQKIVARELGDRGFYILYLYQVEDGLQIANKYHFNGVPSSKGLQNFALKQRWSPDGKQLLFVNSTEDGHDIISMDLWILTDDNYTLFPIATGLTNIIKKAVWQNNNNVIFVENDHNQTFFNVKEFYFNKNGEK